MTAFKDGWREVAMAESEHQDLSCYICGKEFADLTKLEDHRWRKHDE